MYRVGLTGGIGSGKSTVAKIFEILGVPVYYADAEAKRIMNTDNELKEKIISLFGNEAYKNDRLNRHFVSEIVFNDPRKLEQLNALIHPVIKEQGEQWMKRQTTPYAIHEAALIFEAGVAERLDTVIGVSAPEPLRVQRAMKRDLTAYDEVLKRMNRQMPEDEKMKLCHHIIINDEQTAVIPQVLALHRLLLQKAGEKK